MEPKMASKCARAAQLGAQVRLGSPTWQYKSNLAAQVRVLSYHRFKTPVRLECARENIMII